MPPLPKIDIPAARRIATHTDIDLIAVLAEPDRLADIWKSLAQPDVALTVIACIHDRVETADELFCELWPDDPTAGVLAAQEQLMAAVINFSPPRLRPKLKELLNRSKAAVNQRTDQILDTIKLPTVQDIGSALDGLLTAGNGADSLAPSSVTSTAAG